MKKLSLPATAVLAAFISPSAFAEFEYSANVSLVSNYVFRGYTYSDDKMATQGGFDLEHDSGFYAGVWGTSSVDPNGEVDFYAGYGFDLSDNASIDVGVVRYHYPGGDGVDSDGTTEYHVGMSWQDFSLTWHNDVDLETDYVEVNYSIGLSETVGLDLHVGHVSDDTDFDAVDYGITLNFAMSDNYNFFVSFADVDDDSEDSHLFAGLTASF